MHSFFTLFLAISCNQTHPGRQLEMLADATNEMDAFLFPLPLRGKPGYDFSFSGIKSACARFVEKYPVTRAGEAAFIARSFQVSTVSCGALAMRPLTLAVVCAEHGYVACAFAGGPCSA